MYFRIRIQLCTWNGIKCFHEKSHYRLRNSLTTADFIKIFYTSWVYESYCNNRITVYKSLWDLLASENIAFPVADKATKWAYTFLNVSIKLLIRIFVLHKVQKVRKFFHRVLRLLLQQECFSLILPFLSMNNLSLPTAPQWVLRVLELIAPSPEP